MLGKILELLSREENIPIKVIYDNLSPLFVKDVENNIIIGLATTGKICDFLLQTSISNKDKVKIFTIIKDQIINIIGINTQAHQAFLDCLHGSHQDMMTESCGQDGIQRIRAVSSKNIDYIRKYVKDFEINRQYVYMYSGLTLLDIACKEFNQEIIQLLLDHGAHSDNIIEYIINDIEKIQYFIQRGVKINSTLPFNKIVSHDDDEIKYTKPIYSPEIYFALIDIGIPIKHNNKYLIDYVQCSNEERERLRYETLLWLPHKHHNMTSEAEKEQIKMLLSIRLYCNSILSIIPNEIMFELFGHITAN